MLGRKLGNVNYETIREGMGSNLVHRHVDHLLKRSKVRNLCNLRWLGGQRELARSHRGKKKYW